MTEERWKLSPEQDKSLQRIQLVGVVLLGLTVVAMKVLARFALVDHRALLLSGLAFMLAIVMALALLASRVLKRSYGEFLRSSVRTINDEMARTPAKLRQRIADIVSRLRGR